MTRFISAKEAAMLIKDGATVAASGFCGFASCDELFCGIRERFDEDGHPQNLTVIKGVSIGDFGNRGINKIAVEGLIGKLICAHVGLEPAIVKLITENKILAYMLPFGTIIDIINAAGAKKPGVITKVGLGTFADPLIEGSKVNELTKQNGEDIVSRIEINGEECLLYQPIPVDVCLIRATYADEDGNLSIEKEAISADQLELARAAHNSGGIVIAQVEQIVAKGSLRPRDIRVHHFMVDYVVQAKPENHIQSFDCDYYRPELTGEIKVPLSSLPPIPLDNRKVCGRRAAMELRKGTLVNLGIGMPESVAAVAGEEGVSEKFTLSIESGVLGGVPLGGLGLGGTVNPEAIYSMGDTLAVYDGGGLDTAVLGLGEIDEKGNVNVSQFGGRVTGPGGFINISQNTKNVIFTGTFTASGLCERVEDGKLVIEQEGKAKKFKKAVEQITFSGQYAIKNKQNVLVVTERAVFKLTEKGLQLIEIAPGTDIQKDIIDQMEFTPIIDQEPALMNPRIFREELMHLTLK